MTRRQRLKTLRPIFRLATCESQSKYLGVADIECQKLDIFYIIIQHACYIIFQKLIKSKNPGYGISHHMISHEG